MDGATIEGAREWETLKYDSFFIPNTTLNDTADPIAGCSLSSCSETGLTAFCQLAALRLDASRALISLFDQRYQYIIAESTRSMPLRANTKHARTDHLWLCGTAIPRSNGVCEHALYLDDDEITGEEISADMNRRSRVKVSVVPDLTQDIRFKDRAYVRGEPHHRFYAGVPLRSPKGHNIGVMCIFDDKPRHTFPPETVDWMTDLSETVMDYLNARRVSESYRRSERMVHGLGNFLQGRDQPSSWWSETKPPPNRKPMPPRSPSEASSPSSDSGVEVSPSDDPEEPLRPSINPVAPEPQTTPPKTDSSGSVESTATATATNASNALPVDPHRAEVDKVFKKAANVIRYSLDIDGALFFDASVGSFGGLVHPSSHRDPHGSDDPTSSSEDSSSGYSRDDPEKPCKVIASSTSDDSVLDREKSSSQKLLTEKFLKKLLRRYPSGKIFSYDEAGAWYSGESSGGEETDSQPTDPENEPDDNHHDYGSRPQPSKANRSPYSRRNEAKTIGQLFSGARSIAVIPLWDPYRNRWFAGGFFWSKSPIRILTTDADLPYLRAFGMVAMAEITRLDVVIADKAKTDILGSLSHELRSPLHGVVAAAELLHDTSLDPFQVDVVHTIEISGKTLLDTIDHLLAYSKVNTFLRATKSQRRNTTRVRRGLSGDQDRPSIESGMMTLVSDVSLDVLAEEVIESVFIGHSFQHMVASQLSRNGLRGDMTPAQERLDTIYSADISNARSGPSTLPTSVGDVQVVIDIEPHHMWTFHTQAGAIRRIIMNIFGNALKYTSHGFVKISLRQEAYSSKSSMPGASSKVLLTVSDTGKGISDEFLRNKLFTPFSQEDHLAPGTGLGLSLVRQIVASLGGNINVKSSAGRGTTVSVSLPLPYAQKPVKTTRDRKSDARLSPETGILHSLKVAAVGFKPARSPDDHEGQGSGSSGLPLESLPLKWFNMELCGGQPSDGIPTDAAVAVYSEAAYINLGAEALRNQPVPAVIMCYSPANAMKLDSLSKQEAPHGIFEFIHQPNTPRKFGKAVSCALTRWKQRQAATTWDENDSDPSKDSGKSANGGVEQHCGLQERPQELQQLQEQPQFHPAPNRSSVHFAPEPLPLTQSPEADTPHAKRMSDETCRLWDLDVDPEFQLTLPHKRRGSRAGLGGVLGATAPVNGVIDSGIGSSRVTSPTSPEDGQREAAAAAAAAAAVKKVDADGPGQSGGVNEVEGGKPDSPRSHFLVVDDNPINLKLLCTFMKRLGRQHCTANNGLQALETFTENPGRFCCILMDINMPVMDGLESTREIRKFERLHQLDPATIIAITGLGSREAREEAFASGLDLFLTRPVRMRELFGILRERGLSEGEEGGEAGGKKEEGEQQHRSVTGDAAPGST